MNGNLRKIINYYGINTQLKYFQSEVFELNEAIIKDRNSGCLENAINNVFRLFASLIDTTYTDKSREHIKEEIADVMVILKQIQLYYNISTDEVKEVMKSKVNRQLERINDEVKQNEK